jgi:mono/diheme cytochrome c family protein
VSNYCAREPIVSRAIAPAWFGLAALVVALSSGCDWPGKPNPADRPVPVEDVAEFGSLFQRNCAGCHGADGELGPAPPLRNALFRAIVPQAELERVVSNGRPGTPMPAFAVVNGGTLSPAQVRVLVYEIKGIPYRLVNQGANNGKQAAPAPEPVHDGKGMALKWGPLGAVATNTPPYLSPAPASIPTGDRCEEIRKMVFARACAGCHGEHGEGRRGAGAINDPSFLALMSDQALRRLIITGRPDLKMPDYAGTGGRTPDFKPLTSDEIGDLVNLLAFWREGLAAGDQSQAQSDK